MSKLFQFQKKNNSASGLVGLARAMTAAGLQVITGRGPFEVLLDGKLVHSGWSRMEVLRALRRKAGTLKVGETLRVRDKESVVFWLRAAQKAAETIDTSGNDKIDAVWSAAVTEWANRIWFLGAYVCKLVSGSSSPSQHSYGNAVDIGATAALLQTIAEWFVARADMFHLEHVIYKDRIWSRGVGWHAYTGEYHATHVHLDCNPNFSGSCGVRN